MSFNMMDNKCGSYSKWQKYVLSAYLEVSKRFMLGKVNNYLLIAKALRTNMLFFLNSVSDKPLCFKIQT